METKDRRVKREIANSNERRRMQSINAGFQKLKRLLPVNDGEKLSKANILQNAADYIEQIERDKLRLIEQNTLFRGTLIDIKSGASTLDRIDIDALPTIPVNTQLSITTNIRNSPSSSSSSSSSSSILSTTTKSNNNHDNNAHNKSDDNTNNNGNYDSIGAANKSASNKNNGNKETSKTNFSAQSSTNEKFTNQPSSNGVANERGSIAKAAIALPLEVPYTSETAIRVNPPQASPNRKKIKSEPNLDPKQNLDTICKAIMEIEGDRVFNHET